MRPFRPATWLVIVGVVLIGPAQPRSGQGASREQFDRPADQPVSRDQIEERLKQAADLLRRNAFGEALTLLEPLLGAALEREPALAADVHYSIAQAYFRLSKYPEAIEHYRRALEGARAIQDRTGQARTLRAMAQLHKNQGAYTEGLAEGEETLSLYKALGDERNAALTWIVLGAIHDLMGDHRRALESYEQAVPVFGNERSPEAANLSYEMGITCKNLGNYAEALRSYARALDLYVELKDVGNQAVTLGNTGILYGTLGQDDRAIVYNQQAVTLIRQVGDRRGEMIGLLNLADSYWHLGNRQRALELLQQELVTARAIGARTEQGVTLKTLGDIHVAAGELPLAREEYSEALRIERDIDERSTEGPTLVALADLSLREGHADDALRLSEQALTIARDSERPELEWDARRAVAEAGAATGQTARAIDELRASARIINDLRANVTMDASKIAFVDHRQEVFHDLAALLVSTGRNEEALEAAEAGRARAFADLLEQRQILGKPGERGALEAVRLARGELQLAMVDSSSSARPGGASRAAAKFRGGEALDSSLAALSLEHDELASLLTATSPTVEEIVQTTMRLDATLVEYLVTARQLLAWVVDAHGAIHTAKVDVSRAHLEELTKTIRDGIDSVDRDTRRGAAALDPPLRELDRLLVAPLAAWLPASPDAALIIIPHGPLALLPFAALEDEAGRPLAERHVLAFAPAASVYVYTQKKLRAAAGRTRRALIVADPTPPAGSGIERLPWAREEGRQVAARLRGTPLRLLMGKDASEAVVKREANNYSVLHFATHGLVAPERPLASSLLLAAGDGEDGYLRVDEIFNLDLAAELVVLSGCSTGLGRLTGDGMIGLTRAFLYAGTPTLVVSQWNVSDRATSVLMDHFYAELGRGHPKAQALRAAALATRKQFPHAASWAAFELVGEPG